MTVVVFGGSGTFGSLVARALAAAGLQVRIAGRDGERARAFAATLGPRHEGVSVDVNDPASAARALDGARVAVNCSGPFAALTLALPETCLAAGAHYVDIADDRGWFARIRHLDGCFRERSLALACGCSSLPGISGALALLAARRLPTVDRARVTLFIGNRNPKGSAAVRAAASQLGRPFPAPQGRLTGFRGRESVDLPLPFGRRAVYDWESPELDLFPTLLGARDVRVKVGFEARAATAGFAALARLGPRLGSRLALALVPAGRRLSGFGHSGGVVQVDTFGPDGTRATASLGGPEEGQRMAALPAVFVAQGLADGSVTARGFVTAYEALGAQELVDRLAGAGYELAW
ncbi:MAG TPA: saccharopine dehydrogenase NADP-binding domain-containing protein [Thermoanaerobaculia bacterium]|nr:saccharopine dehydrogenase NADP-binding domain-containing protein [Thermoanaerobaculia bacterium]